jgi:hypothetical protein
LLFKLKEQVGKAWREKAGRITVVDAYTPHFGFSDSVHAWRADDVTSEGVIYVSSPESYAGVHTATAKAFNAQKKRAADNVRLPTLLVYEGCRALADLESLEQYRLFLRHVLTSERVWGGMLTIFVEPEAVDADVALMRTYAEAVWATRPSSEVKDGKAENSPSV